MNDFEIAMKDFNIVNLMCIGFDEYEEYINGKVKENEKYAQAVNEFEGYMEVLKEEKGFKYMDKVDSAATTIEMTARDTAFNEGFKMGVKFIQDYISKSKDFDKVSI